MASRCIAWAVITFFNMGFSQDLQVRCDITQRTLLFVQKRCTEMKICKLIIKQLTNLKTTSIVNESIKAKSL